MTPLGIYVLIYRKQLYYHPGKLAQVVKALKALRLWDFYISNESWKAVVLETRIFDDSRSSPAPILTTVSGFIEFNQSVSRKSRY